jgi:glycine/D-amino acid oxidase-like deaminating enzyme
VDLHTGTPFWPLRDGLPYTYPPLIGDATCDVLVVGAGITGAAVAYALAKAGVRVLVVDRRDVASGSSAASTGLLLYETDSSLAELRTVIGHDAALRVYRLGLEAIDEIERFSTSIAPRVEFRRRPCLYLASRRRDVNDLCTEFELRRQHGFDVEWLDARVLKQRFQIGAPSAIYATGTAQVDCYRLTHELLSAAATLGASIHDRSAVTFPSREGSHLLARTNRGGTISADTVVWATGYEAGDLAPPKARFASTWVVITEPITDLSGWPEQCQIWETARPYLYIRSTDDGRMIVGGEDEPCAECHRSAWWFRTKTHRLIKRARRLFPTLQLEVAYAWAGTFSRTDDGLPVIAELDAHPGVWLALGYGGNGITFGVIAARLLAERLVKGSSADLEIFRTVSA